MVRESIERESSWAKRFRRRLIVSARSSSEKPAIPRRRVNTSRPSSRIGTPSIGGLAWG
jgi:hypothetical protein